MEDCNDFSAMQIISYTVTPIMVISTEHFVHLRREFGYTGGYNNELKAAARRFSEKALPSIGLSTPYVEVTQRCYHEDELLLAWRTFRAELEKFGLKTDVCGWIIKLEMDNNLFGRIVSSDLEKVLLDWAMDGENIATLTIASHKIKDFKLMIMKAWISGTLFQLHEIPELNDLVKSDTWENYVVHVRTAINWMINHKRLYQTIAFWVDICRLLSPQEIESLDEWGHCAIKDKFRFTSDDDLFSVAQVADDLRTRGYL